MIGLRMPVLSGDQKREMLNREVGVKSSVLSSCNRLPLSVSQNFPSSLPRYFRAIVNYGQVKQENE